MSEIVWVEHHQHPRPGVTLIERFVPADPGEYAPFLFRPAGSSDYIAMKLVSSRLVGDDTLYIE